MKTTELLSYVRNGALDARLEDFYGEENVSAHRERYAESVESFLDLYGEREVSLFSVAGRSEISGNHTDHNY